MLSYKAGRKIAVLDKAENAVAHTEQTLRITHVFTDYLKREIRVIMHRGLINPDNSFTVTNNEAVVCIISDEPEQEIIRPTGEIGTDGRAIMERVQIPPRPLFTLLTTPLVGHGQRWAGDFRLSDIEQMLMDYNLLIGIEFTEIITQGV